MDTFKWRGNLFRAWSDGVQCRKAEPRWSAGGDGVTIPEDHYPHTWNSAYISHGPYMCWGYPSYRDEDAEGCTVGHQEAIDECIELLQEKYADGQPAGVWRMRAVLRALRVGEERIDRESPRPQPKHRASRKQVPR